MASKGKLASKQTEGRLITYFQDISLPEITISAFTETGQAETLTIVPKQQAYTGRMPVISSHLADTPCATLGIQGILDQLNCTLGTSYTMDTLKLSGLAQHLETYFSYDFGTMYSCLRPAWYILPRDIGFTPHGVRELIDSKMRQNALVENQIINPQLPPRHVWDLYSNRVVPYWITRDPTIYDGSDRIVPWPISHAWMDEKDRVDMWTPINEY